MSKQYRANGHIGQRIRTPGQRALNPSRKGHPRMTLAQSGAGPTTPAQAPGSPLGAGSLPPLPALGLLEGTALGRPSPAVTVLCGVNEASAKAGGGAGAGPGLWEQGRAAAGRPAFVCTQGELARVPVATGTAPARVWDTSTLSPGVGSAYPGKPPWGLLRNPGGEWSEVTRVGSFPMGLRGLPERSSSSRKPALDTPSPACELAPGRQVPRAAFRAEPGSNCMGMTQESFPGVGGREKPPGEVTRDSPASQEGA